MKTMLIKLIICLHRSINHVQVYGFFLNIEGIRFKKKKGNMKLARGQTYRPMEQNREPTNIFIFGKS